MERLLSRSERESTIADARSSEGKTHAERMAMLRDLLATIDALWDHFSPEERLRRMRIADQLNRRPEPWWKHIQPEAIKTAPH